MTIDLKKFENLDGKNFRVLPKRKDLQVNNTITIKKDNDTKTKIATVHSVKGKTFDAVMLVSTPDERGKTGHWAQWFDNSDNEAARIAYVASSRPRYLLVWAIPESKKDELTKIENLGFYKIDDENI